MAREIAFGFRPWVRSTCRKAMIWGIGVVAALGVVAWILRTPGSAPVSRAFLALLSYGLLFWASLAKIWWTAGRPAAVVGERALGYQPLLTFRLRWVPFDRILACGRRAGSRSLRIVHRRGEGRARELFLNLGVIDGRSALLESLGERLAAAGLEPVPGVLNAWRRPGWSEPAWGRPEVAE